MCRLAGLGIVALLLCTSLATAQGSLQRAAGHDEPSLGVELTSGSDYTSDIHTDNSEGWGALTALAIAAATSPIWVPPLVVEDHLSKPGYFPAYPYALEKVNYIASTETIPENNDQKSLLDTDYFKLWAVRLSLEDGNDCNGLNRLGGRLEVDTAWRFGLQTNWNWFHESLGGGRSDETVLGDYNLTYRFAQAHWLDLYAGLGGRILSDRQGTRGGFNCLYGANIFLVEPLVISAQVDVGDIDRALVIHTRATVGWQIGHMEVFAGYDFLRIGGVNLQGPLAGIRLWF